MHKDIMMSNRKVRCSSIWMFVMAIIMMGFMAIPVQAQFPAEKIELLSALSPEQFGANSGNDCWGYTSNTGREYALMGLDNRMSVVEITDPRNPVIIESIAHTSSSTSDIKVYRDYAYVANGNGGGIDIVDLSDVDNGNVTLVKRLTDNGMGSSHNIAINEESGYLYLAIGNINGGDLVAWNLKNDPANPFIEGQYNGNRSHDLHVINYNEGPYAGREIAFSFSEGRGFEIIDVTNKSSMVLLGSSTYPLLGYCHQGWTSADRQYIYLNDEFDEARNGINTRTLVFDITDLENPTLVDTFTSGSTSVDHNLYVHEGFIFQANYTSGLRIFNANVDQVNPPQVGFFDTYPSDDNPNYAGAWSTFPYYPSGNVIISDRSRGLFVVDPSEALGSGEITCDDIKKFKGKCKPNGKAIAILKLRNKDHDGESVVIGFTGENYEVAIKGKRAKATKCCFNATVMISLEKPSGCVEPFQRICQ